MDPILLKVEECARVLNLGRSKVFEMIRRGELPVVRFGRSVRVPVVALRELIEQQTDQR